MELYLWMFLNLLCGILNLIFAFLSWILGESKSIDRVSFMIGVINIGAFVALLSKVIN